MENTPINVCSEAQFIADFLTKHWDGLPDSRNLLEYINSVATVAKHHARYMFDYYRVFAFLMNQYDQPIAVAPSPNTQPELIETLAKISDMNTAGADIDGPWDFEKCALTAPWLNGDPRPKGLLDVCENQDTFEWPEEYENDGDFQGTFFENSLFPKNASLPWVAFSVINHNCSAKRSLVNAIYAHFLDVFSHNNTGQMLVLLESMNLGGDKTEASPAPGLPENPVSRILYNMMQDKTRSAKDFMLENDKKITGVASE